MAFYGESTVVDDFVHGGIEVQIHSALKGPVHCDLPHELEITKCYGCGEKIASTTIYFVIMNESIVDGIECSSAKEAREFAVDYVAHLLDGRDRGEIMDDDIPIDIDDDKADTLRPPPPKQMTGGGDDWGMDAPKGDRPVSAALRVMRQLNWQGKITEIFDRLGIK